MPLVWVWKSVGPSVVNRFDERSCCTCRCPTRLNNLPLSLFQQLAHRAVAKPPGVASEAKDADFPPGAEPHLYGWV